MHWHAALHCNQPFHRAGTFATLCNAQQQCFASNDQSWYDSHLHKVQLEDAELVQARLVAYRAHVARVCGHKVLVTQLRRDGGLSGRGWRRRRRAAFVYDCLDGDLLASPRACRME